MFFTKNKLKAVFVATVLAVCALPLCAADFAYDLTDDESGVVIKKYNGNATDVVIPDTLEGFDVKEIGYMAFEYKNITSVKLPAKLEKIAERAFCNCYYLRSITIPDSVKEIGVQAFCECENLETVVLPAGPVTIGRSAFSGCRKLETVKFPKGPVKIYSYAFSSTAIKNIVITGNMEFVDEYGDSEYFSPAYGKSFETVIIEADVDSLPSPNYENNYLIYTSENTVITFKSPDTVIGENTISMPDTMSLKQRIEVRKHIKKD